MFCYCFPCAIDDDANGATEICVGNLFIYASKSFDKFTIYSNYQEKNNELINRRMESENKNTQIPWIFLE